MPARGRERRPPVRRPPSPPAPEAPRKTFRRPSTPTTEERRSWKSPLGFIGLGRMGGPMARNLAQAGYAVNVFDVDRGGRERGGVPGTTSRLAGRRGREGRRVLHRAAERRIVRGTYLGPHGVLARGARPRHLRLLDGEPGGLAGDCSRADKGILHMDTPMLGSSPQASPARSSSWWAATTTCCPHPADARRDRTAHHVRRPLGTGNDQAPHNALGAVNAAAVAESLALCVSLGVDPKTYYDVVKNGGGMAYSTYFDGASCASSRATSTPPSRSS